MSSPSDVTKILQDALDTHPTIVGQPNDDDLLSLKENLLEVLQTITYDRADGIHHVVGVIQSDTAYKVDHNGDSFPIPQRLGLWDDKIDKDATVVELKKAEAMHKARAEDYGLKKPAKDGCNKLIHDAVEEDYINKLKPPRASREELYGPLCARHRCTSHKHAPPLQKCSQHAGLHPNDGGSPEEGKESQTPHLRY
jgi:hypothetical protein